MEHLGKLSIGFFSKNTSGSIQKIMNENIEKMEGIIAHMMPDLIGSFVRCFTLAYTPHALVWHREGAARAKASR